jgi:hypothetical protein
VNRGILSLRKKDIVDLDVVPWDGPFTSPNDISMFSTKEALEAVVASVMNLPLWKSKIECQLDSEVVKVWAGENVVQVSEVSTLINLLWRNISPSILSSSEPDPKKVFSLKVMLIKDGKSFLFRVNRFKL